MWRMGDGEQTIGLEERTLDFMSWRDLKLCHHPLCFKVQFTEHSLAKCRYSTKWIRKKSPCLLAAGLDRWEQGCV